MEFVDDLEVWEARRGMGALIREQCGKGWREGGAEIWKVWGLCHAEESRSEAVCEGGHCTLAVFPGTIRTHSYDCGAVCEVTKGKGDMP